MTHSPARPRRRLLHERRFLDAINDLIKDKVIPVTGGTGCFGNEFLSTVLAEYTPRKLIVFNCDELKQFDMRQKFSEAHYLSLRYFIGDVRDRDRLCRTMDGVDIVIHAGAPNSASCVNCHD